jgi:hypothetical protein
MNIRAILFAASVVVPVIVFFTWDSIYGTRINVQELSTAYTENTKAADGKYLNKKLFVEGKVKAYYKLMGTRPVLELELSPNSIPVFFFFATQEAESYAGRLQLGQQVVIKGKCLGKDEYSFVNGIKIDVEKFEE